MTDADEGEPAGLETGMRVEVSSDDGSKDYGRGTYLGQVLAVDAIKKAKLKEDAFTRQLLEGKTVPQFRLDSGETIFGFQCRWKVVGPPGSS